MKIRGISLALAIAACFASETRVQAATNVITFQNGVNGYSGSFDRKIDERGGTNEYDGDGRVNAFLDGFQGLDDTSRSPDAQYLLRFADIIGPGANQIPSGAFILDAKFTMTSYTSGSSGTAGPFGVAGLNQAFDSSTTYFGSFTASDATFGSRGAWWEDGYATRPIAGFGPQDQGSVSTIDVATLVQGWADGVANHGLVIQAGLPGDPNNNAGTTDGWGVNSTGFPITDGRPQLSVTYTTDPVEVNTFQRGLNGYSSDTVALVNSGSIGLSSTTNPDPSVDDTTTDASTLTDSVFLDGPAYSDIDGTLSSPDIFGLFKFNNVFGAGAGQSPSDVPVAKAWLVVTTGAESDAAFSNADWSVHQMLRTWDTNSLHSDFGAEPGLQLADGDIAPALDVESGMIRGGEVWFDVTNYLEGVRNGETDNGIAIKGARDDDGWQVYLNGVTDAALRPRLVVASSSASVVAGLAGDFNDDGVVDAADYTVWRDNEGTSFDLNGNGNENGTSGGVVDAADYQLWAANFGSQSGGGQSLGPVPEPTALCLMLMSAATFAGRYRKR